MSNTRRQELCTYLLYAAFIALICAAVLPLLQAIAPDLMAEAGFDPAHPAMLAIGGGLLGGGFYTACRWISRLSKRESWSEMTHLEWRFRRMDRRVAVCFILMMCLFLFVPLYLVALARYWRAR
ncbi:MAG: hypothetical protein IJ438_01355 [Clostridia bacterium]|nr:hypothetical protein [Clostridia bacterium]